jgi:hypothetical protein
MTTDRTDGPDRFHRLRKLFEMASGIPPDQRLSFLDEQCGEDEDLKREILTLLRHHGEPDSLLDNAGPIERDRSASDAAGSWDRLREKLQSRGPVWKRYRHDGELARGGMGAIHQVYDEDLRRTLAMKVVLVRDEERNSDHSSASVGPCRRLDLDRRSDEAFRPQRSEYERSCCLSDLERMSLRFCPGWTDLLMAVTGLFQEPPGSGVEACHHGAVDRAGGNLSTCSRQS